MMDYDSSSKFISSLAKFLQSLCNGYVEFDNGVEVIGHIYLSVDTGKKIDYILNEKVCKTDENSVTFISNSFHAQPAEKPKPPFKKSRADNDSNPQEDIVEIDTDNVIPNDAPELRSTNYGTLARNANRNQPSPSHRHGKRPSSPKSGHHSPNSKKSRKESHDHSHVSDNGVSALSPAADQNRVPNAQGGEGPSLGTDYSDSFQSLDHGEEDNALEESEQRDIKPNIDTDVTFVKEEFTSSQSGEGSDNRTDDASLYSQMYHQPYSESQNYSNQSYGMQSSSRSYGAAEFDSGQASSKLGDEGVDQSGNIIYGHQISSTHQQKVISQRARVSDSSADSFAWRFSCDSCGRQYRRTHDLNRHQWKCLGTRILNCSYCSASFHRPDLLNVHLRRHHPAAVCKNIPEQISAQHF